MAEIDELIFKVGVKVDDDQLKRLREEIKRLQEDGSKNAINLGINAGHTGSTSAFSSSQSNILDSYSDEIAASLVLSEKHLNDMLSILKDDKTRKTRKTDAESEGRNKNLEGPIPFVNNVMNSNVGSLAGGAVGAVGGAIAGGNVIAGAQIGSAIGGLVQKFFGIAKEKIEAVSKLFDQRLTEDIHFRQLSQQTGMLPEQLYKLGVQAKLAGTSLEEVVSSNQRLSDELIGGIDDKKAQLLMALNINPREALLSSGGNVAKLNQTIFERASKATSNLPAAFRTSALNLLGYSPEEQTSRRYLYRKDVSNRAQQSLNIATNNGKTPFETGDKLEKTILDFMGAEQDFLASIRSALTTGNIAQTLSTGLMQVKAETVQLIVGAVDDIMGLGKKVDVKTTTENKTNVINNTVDSNVRQREMLQKQLHRNDHSFYNKSPASQSGMAKAASAG